MKKVLLVSPRGFCAGVIRAIQTVEKALALWGSPIYVKHEIVHNKQVVESLKKKGVLFVENLEDVPMGSILVYSAHGVDPQIRKQAKERQLKEIDATCILVSSIHVAVKNYASKGYRIILIGHKNHVEVLGILGEAPSLCTVIQSAQEVESLTFSPNEKLFYAEQTTFSVEEALTIAKLLKKKYPQIKTLPQSSICYATKNRQQGLLEVAKQADLILVVGDSKSSNTNRLKESVKTVPAYLVQEASEIQEEWFLNVQTVGVTAGASTPETVVQDCIRKLQKLGASEISEVVFERENLSFPLPKEVFFS